MKRSGTTSGDSKDESKASEPKFPAMGNGAATGPPVVPVPPVSSGVRGVSTTNGTDSGKEESEEEDQESEDESVKELNSENDVDEMDDEDEQIMMDIEGITPEESDKASIFNLLNSLLRFMNVDVNLIVDEIIKQNHIGSILNSPTIQGEDEADGMGVLGVCTVITPVHNDASHPVNRIIEFALESSRVASEISLDSIDFYDTLKNWRHKLGFLIYDRFVNLPSAASLAQIKSLGDELRNEPHIEYLLLVERTYKIQQSSPRKFQLFELLLMEELATCVHDVALDVSEYGNIHEQDSDGRSSEGLPYRRLLLIRVDMIPPFIRKCESLVNNLNSDME